MWGNWISGQKRSWLKKTNKQKNCSRLIAYSGHLCNWQLYKIRYPLFPARVIVYVAKIKSQLFLSYVSWFLILILSLWNDLSIILKVHHQANRIIYLPQKPKGLDRIGHSMPTKTCSDKCEYQKGTDISFGGSMATNSDFEKAFSVVGYSILWDLEQQLLQDSYSSQSVGKKWGG